MLLNNLLNATRKHQKLVPRLMFGENVRFNIIEYSHQIYVTDLLSTLVVTGYIYIEANDDFKETSLTAQTLDTKFTCFMAFLINKHLALIVNAAVCV